MDFNAAQRCDTALGRWYCRDNFWCLYCQWNCFTLRPSPQVTDAWSQGDFSEFIEDRAGDEISQLVGHLNRMAEPLQRFIIRSKEMVISEERRRLARDLHDSAKQEALAASFHLGTALTLF